MGMFGAAYEKCVMTAEGKVLAFVRPGGDRELNLHKASANVS
jgi:hypothetical protein